MCTGPQLRVTESSDFGVLLPHLSQQAATVPFQLVYPQAKGGGGQNHQTCINLAHALLLLLVAVASQSNQPGSPWRCLLLG